MKQIVMMIDTVAKALKGSITAEASFRESMMLACHLQLQHSATVTRLLYFQLLKMFRGRESSEPEASEPVQTTERL